jgi:hypothetical protein
VRPGAVRGAIMTSVQTNNVAPVGRMPSLGLNTCPGCNPDPTPNPNPEPAPDPDPVPNPCGDVIPMLGVDICTARIACQGIEADGMHGVFDDASLSCRIPVCAHNWSGVIKKDGKNVCTLTDMNKILRCDSDLFNQIDTMYRTTQYVAPLAVVAGAGIGTGIGAIIDHNQQKKIDKLSEEEKKSGDATATTGAGGKKITFASAEYDLGNPDDVAKLKNALATATSLQSKIDAANKLIDACVVQNFRDLTSPNASGARKWGRIKVSANPDACNAATNDYIYCQFQNMHNTTTTTADCAGHEFKKILGMDEYAKSVGSKMPGTYGYYTGASNSDNWDNGQCYFRDGLGSSESSDAATVQMDASRAEFIKQFVSDNANTTDKNRKKLVEALGQYTFENNITSARGVDGKILNYVLIQGPKFSTIRGITEFGNCNKDELNKVIGGSGAQNDNVLMQAYGALATLQNMNQISGNDNQITAIMTALQNINVAAEQITNIQNGVPLSEISKKLGDGRGFFDKAIGRGLMIGTGVGLAAAAGYWIAEDASIFCNVGGLENVDFRKSYSVPSFRDYLYRKGLIK